jgi:hypothetical protein
MSTELQTVEPDGKLLRSAFCEQAFTELSAQVAELDATTPEGYEKTKNAIRWCVKARSAVSKLKDDLNREALRHQRAVNADEKYLLDLIRTVEDPLTKKKKAVDDEVERKRAELEAKHQAWVNARIAESVEATGKPITTEEAETWSDEQFAEHLEAGRKAKAEADAKAKAEAARLAQEEADRKAKIKAEQDQIAAERAELARQKAEQEAEAKRIKDEQDQRNRDIEAKLAKIQEAEEKAEQEANLKRQLAEREAEREQLKNKTFTLPLLSPEWIEADQKLTEHDRATKQMNEAEAARIQPATVIGENDLAGKVAHVTVGIPGSVFASRIQSVDAPMSNEDMAQVEAMANFPEFPCPGFPEAEAAEDLKGESRDALVGAFDLVDPVCAVNRMAVPIESAQEIMDAAEHEAARKLIAPNHGEIMLLLRTMQAGATRLEALLGDSEGVLYSYQSMAEDISMDIECLQQEMDKLAPK